MDAKHQREFELERDLYLQQLRAAVSVSIGVGRSFDPVLVQAAEDYARLKCELDELIKNVEINNHDPIR